MSEAVDKIKALIDDCTPEDQIILLDYLKARFPQHPLEKEWGVISDVILSAITRSSDLTKRGVRGIIAEAIFAEKTLAPLIESGWEAIQFLNDRPYDFLIRRDSREVRIQVKLQRMEKGVPKIASKRRYPSETDLYVVEVQKTRGGKNKVTNENTRPYRFGEFDILAVNMHPSTKDWTKFQFAVGDWLLPRDEDPALIEIMQPVSPSPTDTWTDQLETCIEWLVKGEQKRILRVDPALVKPKIRNSN